MQIARIIILTFLFFSIASYGEADDVQKRIQEEIQNIDRVIKETETFLANDEKIEEIFEEVSNQVRKVLEAQSIDKDTPAVILLHNPEKGSYLKMGIDKELGFYAVEIPEEDYEVVIESKNEDLVKLSTEEIKPLLPKLSYVVAGIIYVFASVYFVYMAFLNLKERRYLQLFLDVFIWLVATLIMAQMLSAMKFSLR